jgi:hypothetical protein
LTSRADITQASGGDLDALRATTRAVGIERCGKKHLGCTRRGARDAFYVRASGRIASHDVGTFSAPSAFLQRHLNPVGVKWLALVNE